MKTVNVATSFVLAGAIALASAASASDHPYGRFTEGSYNPVQTITKTKSDDHSIDGSFNPMITSTDRHDKHVDIKDDHSVQIKDAFKKDLRYKYTTQTVTPKLYSVKDQDQRGNDGTAVAKGSATGHSLATEGSKNKLIVGNDENFSFMSPTFNNVPVNVVTGPNSGIIRTDVDVAGRDNGVNRGLNGSPVGTTTAIATGPVSQTSGAGVDSSGSTDNSIADPMSVSVDL